MKIDFTTIDREFDKDFDGCNDHKQCGWCGYKGMIDSQGNLF